MDYKIDDCDIMPAIRRSESDDLMIPSLPMYSLEQKLADQLHAMGKTLDAIDKEHARRIKDDPRIENCMTRIDDPLTHLEITAFGIAERFRNLDFGLLEHLVDCEKDSAYANYKDRGW